MQMGKELFDLWSQLDKQQIECQIVMQCAPVLSGEKISNLLSIESRFGDYVEQLFMNSPFSIQWIYGTADKTNYLIYQKEMLQGYLMREDVQTVMKGFGYETTQLTSILFSFAHRYERYRKNGAEFPHEMGVLLGYPLADVTGFLRNKGKNQRYTGYWKVYGDVTYAKFMFQKFDQARTNMLFQVSKGECLKTMIDQRSGLKNTRLQMAV